MPKATGPRKKRDPLETVKAFALAHDREPDHIEHVLKNSLALFDSLQTALKLSPRERFLLEAAALLHDIGYETRPLQHHKGSRDMIVESGLAVFPGHELQMVACIARYHRGAAPKDSHKFYMDLSKREKSTVKRLASLLRIADGLDRTHAGLTTVLSVENRADGVTIRVRKHEYCVLDIAAALKKSGLFREVFKTALTITQG